MKLEQISRREFLRKVGLAAGTSMLVACNPQISFGVNKKVVKFAMAVDDFRRYDPHTSTAGSIYPIVDAMCDGVVRNPPWNPTLDPEKIEPDLAKRWKVKDNGLTWDLTLREGVQFHKGYGEFTAEDVKFSIDRVRDPELGSPWKERFAGWEINIKDKYNLEITTPRPDPLFLGKLFPYQSGNIVSMKAAQELGEEFPAKPIGTGPFQFVEYRPGEKIILEAHENYWRGKPKLDRVEFLASGSSLAVRHAILREEAHLARHIGDFLSVQTGAQEKGILVDFFGIPACINLFFNTEFPPLKDVRVRRAICHAIDPDSAARIAGEGTEIYSPVKSLWQSPEIWGVLDREERFYPYDPDRAQKLLKEAGYGNGLDLGSSVVIDSAEFIDPMIIYQEQLAKVGISLKIEPRTVASYFDAARGGRNSVTLYMAKRLPDATVYLEEFFHSRNIGQNNLARFADDQIDSLIEEAKGTVDANQRAKITQKAIRRSTEELALVKPTYKKQVMGTRNPHVKFGYKPLVGNFVSNYKVTERTDWAK